MGSLLYHIFVSLSCAVLTIAVDPFSSMMSKGIELASQSHHIAQDHALTSLDAMARAKETMENSAISSVEMMKDINEEAWSFGEGSPFTDIFNAENWQKNFQTMITEAQKKMQEGGASWASMPADAQTKMVEFVEKFNTMQGNNANKNDFMALAKNMEAYIPR